MIKLEIKIIYRVTEIIWKPFSLLLPTFIIALSIVTIDAETFFDVRPTYMKSVNYQHVRDLVVQKFIHECTYKGFKWATF